MPVFEVYALLLTHNKEGASHNFMEFLASLPTLLADLGYKLFSRGRDDATTQKENFANLIERISECINEIGVAIRDGKHAESQCAELSIYLREIGILAADITDHETASALTFALYHVEEVPGFAKIDLEKELKSHLRPSWFQSIRYQRSKQVLRISGELSAIANLLRL